MQTGSKTLIGIFSDVTDAKRATDELRALGISQVRLVENDQDVTFTGTAERQGASSMDSTDADFGHKKSGIGAFFARLFGFDDEKDRSTWSLNRDSEAYFQGTYDRKHHLVVIEDSNDPTVCREVITRFGGEVEEQGIHFYDTERYRDRDLTASLNSSGLPREDSTVASADMHSVESTTSRPRMGDDSPLSSRVNNEDGLFQTSRASDSFLSSEDPTRKEDNLFRTTTPEDRAFGAPQVSRDPSLFDSNRSTRDDSVFNASRSTADERSFDSTRKTSDFGSSREASSYDASRTSSLSSDDSFISGRKSSDLGTLSSDDSFSANRKSSVSDDSFGAERKSSLSNDDSFGAERKSSLSNDDSFGANRKSSLGSDDSFGANRTSSLTGNDPFGTSRKSSVMDSIRDDSAISGKSSSMSSSDDSYGTSRKSSVMDSIRDDSSIDATPKTSGVGTLGRSSSAFDSSRKSDSSWTPSVSEGTDIRQERMSGAEASLPKELTTEIKTVDVPAHRSLEGASRENKDFVHIDKKLIPRDSKRLSDDSHIEEDEIDAENRDRKLPLNPTRGNDSMHPRV